MSRKKNQKKHIIIIFLEAFLFGTLLALTQKKYNIRLFRVKTYANRSKISEAKLSNCNKFSFVLDARSSC